MQFPSKYKWSTGCRQDISLLMNDYFFLYKNLTDQTLLDAHPEWDNSYNKYEGVFLNMSGIIANNWAKTLGSCFKFENQIFEDMFYQKERYAGSFVLFIQSFVFNLLEESI